MSKFKEGDKFRAIKDFGVVEKGSILVGKEGFTTKDGLWYAGEGFVNLENYLNKGYGSECLELVEENKMKFDMKTQAWFINVDSIEQSIAAQQWLFDQGFTWCTGSKTLNKFQIGFFTNFLCWNENITIEPSGFMHSTYKTTNTVKGEKEIKLNFKTVVDSVEWPEVETEAQKELAKLQKQIEELSAQAEKLKETIK